MTRLFRLIELSKLVRMAKMGQKSSVNKIIRIILEKLNMNSNSERMFYYLLSFLFLCHLSACFFFLIAKLEGLGPDSWVMKLGYIDYSNFDLYIIAFHWTLTTVTTVGYGDVVATTVIERIFSLFIMSFGVLFYSAAIGALTSLVSKLDAKTAGVTQKLQSLKLIKKEFKISDNVYDQVRRVIKYDYSNKQKENSDFLYELPNKLKIELSKIIHDNMIMKLNFFKDKTSDFIAFVAPLLKSIRFNKNDYLYKIGENIDECIFNLKNFNFK